jgi:ureidoacrylate peracid hydrolase
VLLHTSWNAPKRIEAIMSEDWLWPEVRALVQTRRGRLHAIETLDPKRTALIVIDMQSAFVDDGTPSYVGAARAIIPNINRLAAAVRRTGGHVTWARVTFSNAPDGGWSSFFGHTVSEAVGRDVIASLQDGAPGHALVTGLDVQPSDTVFNKTRFSAFTRGSSNIEDILRARGLDTVLIVGTLTHVCCESTARDAMQLGFKTIMVSDANASRIEASHRAALNAFIQSFGDVRSTGETIALLNTGAKAAPRAAE